MLGQKYKNDGIPHIQLTPIQMQMKNSVDEKVSLGTYKFEEVDCCVCGRKNFKILSLKDRYGLFCPVVICQQCGLVQTNPRMTKESYGFFYNCEYNRLDRVYFETPEPQFETFFQAQYSRGESIHSYIKNKNILIKPMSEMFVLEVGCGAGGILKYFKDKGCRIKGIDLGKECLEYGINKYNLDLSLGTIFDVKIEGNPDLIIYSHVIEHLLMPNKELSYLNKIIDKDGVLYVALPGIKNLKAGKNLLDILRNAHVYHFSLTTLCNLMTKNGWYMADGNEQIKSLFKISDKEYSSAQIVNDYNVALSYLKKVERWGWLFSIYTKRVADPAKIILLKWYKKIKLCLNRKG